MGKENTSIRLKKIMSDRNLRQTDILELCKPYCQKYNVKLGRNDLSQYVSGKVEPGQKKLTVLGMALNVNEAWLMGYELPMERFGEDQNILRYDAELEHALEIIGNAGYSWNYSMDPDYDIIIKNSLNEIISCIHEYELVSVYEYLQKKNNLTAKSLIDELKFYFLSINEQNHIKKYRVLDRHGKEMVDFTLQKEWERSTAYAQNNTISLIKESEPDYLAPNAAHERTGIDLKEEERLDDESMID